MTTLIDQYRSAFESFMSNGFEYEVKCQMEHFLTHPFPCQRSLDLRPDGSYDIQAKEYLRAVHFGTEGFMLLDVPYAKDKAQMEKAAHWMRDEFEKAIKIMSKTF